MTAKKGKRPWTIHLFALAFLLAGLVRLANGLSGAQNWINLLYGAGSDAAIIAHFTEFTIALFPLVWVYWLASGGARYVVLAFGLVRLAGFVFGIELGTSLVSIIEPLCILVGLAAMLSERSSLWIEGQESLETFR
ncbi:hypothetical protein [Erythrobacter sp. THAF29]|uniref:hypothetical protein n=1 Tax=Erythrobacter sp. THAF29 TaxID=2587851 RepID=UPI00126942C2|nr:hypothetical protein [Erythrobacter sp. THAF29]QFT76442.1 hypothetical protein FIU90_02685 [Erythrobacter sp. THAF29]